MNKYTSIFILLSIIILTPFIFDKYIIYIYIIFLISYILFTPLFVFLGDERNYR